MPIWQITLFQLSNKVNRVRGQVLGALVLGLPRDSNLLSHFNNRCFQEDVSTDTHLDGTCLMFHRWREVLLGV